MKQKERFYWIVGIVGAILLYKWLTKEKNVEVGVGADLNFGTIQEDIPTVPMYSQTGGNTTTIDKYAGTRAEGSRVMQSVYCPKGKTYDRTCACCKDNPTYTYRKPCTSGNTSRRCHRRRMKRIEKHPPSFY
jgi:hypothetical protein